jgi:hypothetical protein
MLEAAKELAPGIQQEIEEICVSALRRQGAWKRAA